MAQKEYLKMADVFCGNFGGDIDDGQVSGWEHKGKYVPLQKIQQYAAHAINSHDELVDEVERLREINCKNEGEIAELKHSLRQWKQKSEYWQRIAEE